MRKKQFSWLLLAGCLLIFGFLFSSQGSLFAQANGQISGTVTNVIGSPLSGIEVYLYRQIGGEWTYETYDTTDANGDYAFNNLNPESYRLQFKDWSQTYAYQYYDGASRLADATDIPVANGSSVTIDVTMELAGKIAGTVTGPSGQPLEFPTLIVYEHETQDPNEPIFVTQPTGTTYEFGGLPTGDYIIRYTGRIDGIYYNEFYQDKYDFSTADPIPVVTGFTTDNINAVLGEPINGEINGVVRSEGGPVGGIEVSLYRYDSSFGTWQLAEYLDTDSGGTYTFDELTPGQYRLKFYDWSQTYAFEFYDNAVRLEDATDIFLAENEILTMPDVILDSAGRIAGTLTAPGGGLLENAFVWVFLEEDDRGNVLFYQQVTDGTYNIGGLPTANYHVQFTGQQGQDNFNEYYNDQPDWESADPVPVTAGLITANINAELGNPPGGIIAGEVTDIYGRAFDIARVKAYTNISGTWQLANTETIYNNDPTYDLDLPPGTYRIEFEGESYLNPGNPTTEVYDDVQTLAQGQDLTLALGQTISGINARLGNYATGSISGQVTDENGAPLSGIEVYVYDRGLGLLWDQIEVTDANGNYTVNNLWPEAYFVEFYDPNGGYFSEFYDDSAGTQNATRVTVNYDAVNDIDAELAAAPAGTLPGSIAGVVTDESSNPLFGVAVSAYEGASGDYAGNAYTASDGSYRVRGLGSVSQTLTYTVRFQDSNGFYVTEWYDDAESEEMATAISVTTGLPTTGIDAELALGGKIAGNVTKQNGTSFSLLTVTAYQFDPATATWVPVAQDNRLNESSYEIDGLPAGTYRVSFYGGSWTGNGYIEFYDDVATVEAGTDITVTAGLVTNGIDAVLGPDVPGEIMGTVTDGAGNPLAGITVRAVEFDNAGSPEETTTLADGSYVIEDLYNGVYYVEFEDPTGAYPGEWYDDAASAVFATPILISDTVISGIDAALDGATGGPGGGSISGTVTLEGSGDPLANVEVRCYDIYYNPIFNCQTATDANGDYFLGGFLPETAYYLRFETDNGSAAAEYYDDAATINVATAVSVTLGTTVPDIDAALTPAGYISGTISDPNGDPFDIQSVAAYTFDGTDWVYVNGETFVYSDDPDYILGGLPAGTYRIRFSGGSIFNPTRYDEYYDDVEVIENGTDITVTAGAVTPNINAVLGDIFDGGISGQVTDQNGTGLGLVKVIAYRDDGFPYRETVTDGQGNYSLDMLPENNYFLGFFDQTDQYQTEYYDDQPDLASATAISVTDSVVTGIDASLANLGQISGTVTDPSGSPLDYVQVTAYTFNGSAWVTATTTFADPAGDYILDDLAPDTYRVEFMGYRVNPGGPPQMYVEYYDDQADIQTADDLIIQDGGVLTGIDATLGNITPLGQITGTIMDLNNNALPNVTVAVYVQDQSGQWISFGEVNTGSDGTFMLDGMADSHYRLCFSDPSGVFNGECYDDAPDVSQANNIIVDDGQTTAGINVWLEGEAPPTATYTIYMPAVIKQ